MASHKTSRATGTITIIFLKEQQKEMSSLSKSTLFQDLNVFIQMPHNKNIPMTVVSINLYEG